MPQKRNHQRRSVLSRVRRSFRRAKNTEFGKDFRNRGFVVEALEPRQMLAAESLSPVNEFGGGPVIEGAQSRLMRDDAGLELTINTNSLDPAAYTVWWVIFNNPEFCTGPCNGPDLRDPAVEGLVTYATGEVVDDDGMGSFRAELAIGDTTGVADQHKDFGGASVGLMDPYKAEIHAVVRGHGAADTDPRILDAQLTTFDGGCDKYECVDVQGTGHLPPDVTFDNQVMHMAGGDADIPASTTRLTRGEDGVSVRVDAGELPPGDAVTLWWAIFNHPELCDGPCNGPDLRKPEVEAGLFYGGGEVVGEDGTLTIMSTRSEGDTAGVDTAHAEFAGAQTGLIDSRAAEIHVALRTHGAASDDPVVLAEQLGTFNGGCNLECRNLQAAGHLPPGTEITVNPINEFGGGPVIEGSESRLSRDADGVDLTINTNSLEPAAYTVWWVVFNNPENCTGPCNGPDLRDPAVDGLVTYATGEVVGDDGIGSFAAHLDIGDPAGVAEQHKDFPGATKGLIDPYKAEIHAVVRSHGPALMDPDMLQQQLTTFDGGCDVNTCVDVQGVGHLPPSLTFDNQVMHVAGGDMDIPASTSRLTRGEDGVSVRVDAGELPPGDAVTLWWAIFNHPELCDGPCNGPDLRKPEVGAGLFYGGGDVVAEDGTLTIMSVRDEGDTSGVDMAHADFAGAMTGLIDSRAAEIHVALRSHGAAAADPDILAEQLGTFNGGCNPECGNLQAAGHLPPDTEITIGPVNEFNGPPLGPPIEGAESRLTRHDDGITLTVNTNGLEPAAYTVWWVVFNNPEFCSGGCNGPDLSNPAVEGTVMYATGEVVGDDGIGAFTAHLAEGDISGVNEPHQRFPGSDNGLIDSSKAEIHFVVRSHGPASDDPEMLEEQLTTFNGGCNTDDMDGFECFDPQAGVHPAPDAIASVGAVHQFNGPPLGPAIEGAESRLTRHDDRLTLTVNTLELEPAAYTVWWIVFNNPEFCASGCNGPDLRNPAVEGTVMYATGMVVGDDGIGNFTAQLDEGDTSGVNEPHRGFPGSDNGLIDARKAEIHYVVRSHGPAADDPELLNEQLTTFNGGCKTDDMDGFDCFDPQAGFHLPPNPILLGDVNDDGQFDQLDIVDVLQAGKYRTGQPATFAEGDWNSDGVFDQFDVITVLQTGRYVTDANAALAGEESIVDALMAALV